MTTQTQAPLEDTSVRFRSLLALGLVLVVLVLFVVDIVLGSVAIPWKEVVRILVGYGSDNQTWVNIIEKIRLPKALTAMLAGSALAVSGLQMQTLFRNPLAGPTALGLTAGASLGVAVILLSSGSVTTVFVIRQLGWMGSWLIILSAIAGSSLVLLLLLAISAKIGDNVVLLIIGLMIGNVTVALVSIWQYFSQPEQIQEYLLWTFGSLGGVTQRHLYVLSIVISVGLLLSLATSKALNVMLLGQNYARSMGLPVRRARLLIIMSTSILAGSITAFCGPIGFIGMAVPHLTRSLLNTADHRVLIPGTCLVGAILMLFCDIVAQVPGSQTVLPINAITALIGAPVVIWVIMRRRNLQSSFS
ncbi:MAG: iron ABC transporter permease [Bacteroidota bacterium]